MQQKNHFARWWRFYLTLATAIGFGMLGDLEGSPAEIVCQSISILAWLLLAIAVLTRLGDALKWFVREFIRRN